MNKTNLIFIPLICPKIDTLGDSIVTLIEILDIPHGQSMLSRWKPTTWFSPVFEVDGNHQYGFQPFYIPSAETQKQFPPSAFQQNHTYLFPTEATERQDSGQLLMKVRIFHVR